MQLLDWVGFDFKSQIIVSIHKIFDVKINIPINLTGLYGNDDLHNGLLEVLTAGRKVDNIISSVRNQTHILENTLAQKIRPQLVELADIFDQPASNQTALSQLIMSLNVVQGNVTVATNAAGDIRRPLMRVTMTSFLSVILKLFMVVRYWLTELYFIICREEISGN